MAEISSTHFSHSVIVSFKAVCLLGMYRIAILTGYRILLDSWRTDSAGCRIPNTIYANNQCGFVLSQLCFKDLKQFCRYGANERY